jgi:hypothetical protein
MLLVVLIFVLPLISCAFELALCDVTLPIVAVLGKWLVFWGVGVRLLLAGARQITQPSFTVQKILGVTDERSFVLVRQLGFANIALGTIAVASLIIKSWVMPAAVAGAIFLGLAGVNHMRQSERNSRENLAMFTDLVLAALLALFCLLTFTHA